MLGSRRARALRAVETDHRRRDPRAGADQARRAPRALARAARRSSPAREPQRIGLSATQRPLDEVARFLGGDRAGRRSSTRPSGRASTSPSRCPAEDMEAAAGPESARSRRPARGAARHVAAIHPRLLELVRAHRSTIVFVNSRRLCERLAQRLNELRRRRRSCARTTARSRASSARRSRRRSRPGSCAASSRRARSSSASTWARSIWCCRSSRRARCRAGCSASAAPATRVGGRSIGRIFPKFRGDLLEATVVARGMLDGEVEATPRAAEPARRARAADRRDGRRASRGRSTTLERVVRRAAQLPRRCRASSLVGVLDMLAGRYPSDEFAELRPRLVWDRATRRARARARRAAPRRRRRAARSPIAASTRVHLGDRRAAHRRARRGDGAREPRRADVHPRRVDVAHRRRSRATA